MSDLKTLCLKYFNTHDLYKIFGLEKTATQTEVRKSYYRMAISVHPDKVENDKTTAEEKFKIIGTIYSILSDDEKRKVYDSTGIFDDSDLNCNDWYGYFRKLFKKTTLEDIKAYEEKYKGSEEEENDLKRAYLNYEGNMDYILETVLFGHPDEEPRYMEILSKMIETGEVPDYNMDKSDTDAAKARRKGKYEREAKEFNKLQKKMKSVTAKSKPAKQSADVEDADSLMEALRKKHFERIKQTDALFRHLEEKYVEKKKRKK